MEAPILLVEDNPADVYLIRKALEGAGVTCPIKVLQDGSQALSFVQEEPAAELPSLIVLDLNLPRNDGVEVLDAIKRSKSLAAVPVAVLTTSRSPRDRAEVERHPGVTFIAKPVELDEFLSIGEKLRALLEGAASANAGTRL